MSEQGLGISGASSEEQVEQEERLRPYGRRALVLGAVAAGAGAAVTLVAGAQPAAAADGGAVLLGESNKANATTKVTTKTGDGIEGSTTDTAGNGVAGVDTSTGGGTGVRGTSTNGNGVYGQTSSSGGSGVFGISTAGTGVQGFSTDGNGVYAYSVNADALYVDGDATVTGVLSKGGGSFKIDHPLDPAHKYLYHSFVESPDMMNVYNGTVSLDGDGRANVELPDWFEALNRDFRYQLTAIGSAAPELHVAVEVTGNAFTIAGGRAGQKVSWQVTGVRQDTWANANRIPVEVDKPAEEKGRYLHPELFRGELTRS